MSVTNPNTSLEERVLILLKETKIKKKKKRKNTKTFPLVGSQNHISTSLSTESLVTTKQVKRNE